MTEKFDIAFTVELGKVYECVFVFGKLAGGFHPEKNLPLNHEVKTLTYTWRGSLPGHVCVFVFVSPHSDSRSDTDHFTVELGTWVRVCPWLALLKAAHLPPHLPLTVNRETKTNYEHSQPQPLDVSFKSRLKSHLWHKETHPFSSAPWHFIVRWPDDTYYS